jgi:hypothetical protein
MWKYIYITYCIINIIIIIIITDIYLLGLPRNFCVLHLQTPRNTKKGLQEPQKNVYDDMPIYIQLFV